MNSRATGFALAVVAVGALAFQAHAGGFNFGSFMLGNGGKSWVPECKAPEKLTEITDSAGKRKWICAAKQAADDKTRVTDKAQIAETKTEIDQSAVQIAAANATATKGQLTDEGPQLTDGAVQVALGMTQPAFRATHLAGSAAPAVDSKPLTADRQTQTILGAELERPISPQ